jgi:1,4-dihydroxy-2-naphthoate octaprenyltransferase
VSAERNNEEEGYMKIDFAMWAKALQGVPRITKEEWDRLDLVSRWLIATRAMALVLSFISATIAGLLALQAGEFNLWVWLLLSIGLVMAHGTNNLLNDYTDYSRGVDKGNYFRAQYGPQPLEHGLLTKRQLLTYAAVTGLIAVAAGVLLIWYRGWPTAILMAAGAVFVLFYTYPFKYIGLGEVSLLLVWGPLMVGGGYYVFTGDWDWQVVIAGLSYSLGVTAALMGKHIDKLDADAAKKIRTLPVLLGERLARAVTVSLIVLQFLLVGYLMIIGFFTPVMLVVFLSLPMFFKMVLPMYRHPRPAERPENYPAEIWPLWFVASAFAFSRRFGILFLAGLILDTILRLLILPALS